MSYSMIAGDEDASCWSEFELTNMTSGSIKITNSDPKLKVRIITPSGIRIVLEPTETLSLMGDPADVESARVAALQDGTFGGDVR